MKNKTFIIAVIIFITLSGCNVNLENNEDSQNEQLSAEKDKNEVPKDLESIEESIEKIFLSLNGPASNVEETEDNQEENNQTDNSTEDDNEENNDEDNNQDSNQDNNQDNNEDEDDEDNNQDDENQDTNNAKEDSEKAQDEDVWVEIDSTINKLHYQWNGFTSSAMEINASKELIDNFSVALNSLTNTTLNRNQANSLIAASNLYSHVPDLYMLFDTQYSPEIKRLRHYTRNAILNALAENWTDSKEDLKNLKSSWSFYKTSIQKDRPERSNKLDYSIQELETVINEKNKYLSNIKGKVALNNIDVIEKEQKEEND
ncbi:hypothetical protein RBH29_00965 [Herbivorax sp. ANBcel31]|uniref:hypothetical protein n=1 Tax=Herbivorax sp. ANBcel31 TaxID=3069754 RepID=UPI0027B0BA32|nr:hypothetical protein [Herbivorax sp. ANBcel31]MDQ2085008.1 hypothetical protein [Herbivorax sp. ANBcel31]